MCAVLPMKESRLVSSILKSTSILYSTSSGRSLRMLSAIVAYTFPFLLKKVRSQNGNLLCEQVFLVGYLNSSRVKGSVHVLVRAYKDNVFKPF